MGKSVQDQGRLVAAMDEVNKRHPDATSTDVTELGDGLFAVSVYEDGSTPERYFLRLQWDRVELSTLRSGLRAE